MPYVECLGIASHAPHDVGTRFGYDHPSIHISTRSESIGQWNLGPRPSNRFALPLWSLCTSSVEARLASKNNID